MKMQADNFRLRIDRRFQRIPSRAAWLVVAVAIIICAAAEHALADQADAERCLTAR